MDDLTKAAEVNFAADKFATETTGIVIEKAEKDYARCHLDVEPRHLNAQGKIMGGAIFTLADFTFAIASNGGNMDTPTVTLSSEIQYLSAMRGSRLTAESVCLKSGRGTCVMEIVIKDDTEKLIAKVTSTGYRLNR